MVDKMEKRYIGSVTKSNFYLKDGTLLLEGWFLPVPDKIKIRTEDKVLGLARLGLESESVYNKYPEYNEKRSRWVFGGKIKECFDYLEVHAIYGDTCEKLIKVHISDVSEGYTGKVTRCMYNKSIGDLDIRGWFLPKADRVEIWNEEKLLGLADTGLESAYIHERFPEFGEKYSEWRFRNKTSQKLTEIKVKIFYDDYCVKNENVSVKEVSEIKSGVFCCGHRGGQIVAEGYFLPNPDKVEVWEKGNFLGDARIGIPAPSIYNDFPEYDEKNALWTFGVKTDKKVFNSSLIFKAFYHGGCRKEINVLIKDIVKPIKGRIQSCQYNPITDILRVKGWYLPKADKVEIWNGGTLCGNAKVNVKSESIYKQYKEFNELYSIWEFSQRIAGLREKKIIIKVFYDEKEVWEEAVEVIMDNHKIVSFDVFDTLLVRPALQPTEMFKIVALRAGYDKCFRGMRMTAEKIARDSLRNEWEDITINDIYQQFVLRFGISEEEAERLKQIELNVEWDYLRPRKSIYKLFKKAQDLGKEIIVISDMYLPVDFIRKVLEKNGYYGISRIYVSGEEKAAKGTGNLFHKVIDAYSDRGIMPSDILHIGDNQKVDVIIPTKIGIQADYFPKTTDVFSNMTYYREYKQNLKSEMDNCFFAGYIANELFDDCYTEFDRNSFFDGDFSIMGKVFFAPILLNFVLWMLRDLNRQKISELLLTFRDGYMIEKIIDILQPFMRTEYRYQRLYLSRTIRYNGYVRKKNGFWQALIEYPLNNMTVSNFIKKRLLVENERERKECLCIIKERLGLEPDDLIGGIDNVLLVLLDLEPYFVRHAEENMKIIDEYCQSMVGEEKKAVFDIGYRGKTVDFMIDNYSASCKGYQLFGYSLMDKHDLGCENTETYISYGFRDVRQLKILHHLFEDVLCIQEGTAKCIKKKEVGYEIIREGMQYNPQLTIIQESVLNTIENFVEMFHKDLFSLEFERYPEFDLISYFLKVPNKKDAESIRRLSFSDSEFIGKPGESAYEDWYMEFFGMENVNKNDRDKCEEGASKAVR